MREYDKDFKEEAIKLSCEIGPTAAAEKLGIPVTTQNGMERLLLLAAGISVLILKQLKFGQWKKRSKNLKLLMIF